MTDLTSFHRGGVLAVVCVALASCQSPSAVDLAKTTAQNESLLQSQLADFAERSKAISGRRVDIIVGLKSEIAIGNSDFNRDLGNMREAGISDPPALYDKLHDIAVAAAQEDARLQTENIAFREQVIASQKALDLHTEQLQLSTKALLALSHELSFSEQVAVLQKFVSDVAAEVQKSKAAAAEAQKKAETTGAQLNVANEK